MGTLMIKTDETKKRLEEISARQSSIMYGFVCYSNEPGDEDINDLIIKDVPWLIQQLKSRLE